MSKEQKEVKPLTNEEMIAFAKTILELNQLGVITEAEAINTVREKLGFRYIPNFEWTLFKREFKKGVS